MNSVDILNEIYNLTRNKKSFLLKGGAGSGKTSSLVNVINNVIENDKNASILCLTYTNIAKNEIIERLNNTHIVVDTINSFLWKFVSLYQKDLLNLYCENIEKDPFKYNYTDNKLVYEGSKKYDDNSIPKKKISLKYKDFSSFIFNMFTEYEVLSKIFTDLFTYVFIDEYQDTDEQIVNIFLDIILRKYSNKICIGFFGDENQNIYGHSFSLIDKYFSDESLGITILENTDNYRCSEKVIKFLNSISKDIQQDTVKDKTNTMLNKVGNVTFYYKKDENLKIYEFFQSKYPDYIILNFLHKDNAIGQGFSGIYKAYETNSLIPRDYLIKKETQDSLAKELMKIVELYNSIENKNYRHSLKILKKESITTHKEISEIYSKLNIFKDYINNGDSKSINDVFKFLKENNIFDFPEKYIKKSEQDLMFVRGHYNSLKDCSFDEVFKLYEYVNEESNFNTKHNVKGDEFDNVIVMINSEEKCIVNNCPKYINLFYVACSRAKNNLIIASDYEDAELLSFFKARNNIVDVKCIDDFL